MNVSLTPELEKFVERKVASGLFPTAGDVMREALRLLQERDEQYQKKRTELLAEIDLGLRDSERGKVAPFDGAAVQDIIKRGRKRLARRSKTR